jgi:hypothetical protein
VSGFGRPSAVAPAFIETTANHLAIGRNPVVVRLRHGGTGSQNQQNGEEIFHIEQAKVNEKGNMVKRPRAVTRSNHAMDSSKSRQCLNFGFSE